MLADSMSGESLFIDDIFVCLLAFLCLLRVAVTRGLCGTSFIFDKGTDPNHGGSVLMTQSPLIALPPKMITLGNGFSAQEF